MIAGISANRSAIEPRKVANPKFGSLQSVLPITSRLLNPRELLMMGALTRMGIGLLRIEENIPTENRKPRLTREQKFSALFERIFMEAVGVPFHLISLYIPQEIAAKVFERSSYLKLPTANHLTNLPKQSVELINAVIRKVYLPKGQTIPAGIMAKQIYDRGKMTTMFTDASHMVANALKHDKVAKEQAVQALTKTLMPFTHRVWTASAVALALGVVVSAFLSGYVMQWVNDHVMSKKVIPALLRQFGIAPATPARQVYMPGPIPANEAQRTFRM